MVLRSCELEERVVCGVVGALGRGVRSAEEGGGMRIEVKWRLVGFDVCGSFI